MKCIWFKSLNPINFKCRLRHSCSYLFRPQSSQQQQQEEDEEDEEDTCTADRLASFGAEGPDLQDVLEEEMADESGQVNGIVVKSNSEAHLSTSSGVWSLHDVCWKTT